MEKDTLVVLAAYNSETEAEIDKTKLESAGIWAMIRNEYMSTFYPTGALPAELVVRSSDLAKARKLFAGTIKGCAGVHPFIGKLRFYFSTVTFRLPIQKNRVCCGG